MVGTHHVRHDHALRGEYEARFRIAGAEWRKLIQRGNQVRSGRARLQRTIDQLRAIERDMSTRDESPTGGL